MKTYNKLVRDKIPDIIAAEGKKYQTKTLSDKEYLKELIKKLGEEAKELQKNCLINSHLISQICYNP